MKQVLVTGAAGFVGRHACDALAARGFAIHRVGRGVTDDPTSHAVDLLDANARRAVIERLRPSHLLHLAWDAEPGRYWTSPANLDWVAASLDLVRHFVACGGRRLVVAGTCAEYEWGSARFHETATPCRPATLYGAAKDGTRRVVEAYARTVGLSAAWGRLFYLYGPGEHPGRLVADAARALLAGHTFATSPGHQARDFLHVSDAADALCALLDSAVEGPVNIGSGLARPVRAVLNELASQTGRSGLLDYGARPLGSNEPATIAADIRRLHDEVGFQPRFDLRSGLADTVAWWRPRLPGG